MIFVHVFFVFWGAALIFGYQNSYEVTQERLDREYVDNSLVDMTCGVYKSNRTTNALNLTVKFKHALTDHDMFIVTTGYKWRSNEYRLDIVQFQDPIKKMMDLKYFDINRLFCNYTTPPFVWSMKTGVTYHMFNWIPDSTQFPPGFPEGRWKLLMNSTKADKTPFLAISWYFKIEYKIKLVDHVTHKPRRH